jgi:hypothetical protein
MHTAQRPLVHTPRYPLLFASAARGNGWVTSGSVVLTDVQKIEALIFLLFWEGEW